MDSEAIKKYKNILKEHKPLTGPLALNCSQYEYNSAVLRKEIKDGQMTIKGRNIIINDKLPE